MKWQPPDVKDASRESFEKTLSLADGVFRRVLVVEDSASQRRLLAASLKRWGFEVTEAETGDRALEIAREGAFDLVISDWMMPGMSGPEFCRAFRALGNRYGYFILLTSRTDKVDVVKGLESGADDFLSKPVGTAELRARILAGARVLKMEREVSEKNRQIEAALTELRGLYSALERDLNAARTLQMSLVPPGDMAVGRSNVAQLLVPSGFIGGDLVGHFQVSGRQLGLYALDVSGHGVASALLGARLVGFLSRTDPERNVALSQGPDGYRIEAPEEICHRLNTRFAATFETDLYFTMLFARVDLQTGLTEIAQAGHPHPMVIRADGSVERLGDGGMPVGLFERPEFSADQTTLGPGDKLVFFSDGVTECADPSGRFLEDGELAAILSACGAHRGARFLEDFQEALRQFSGGAEMGDDVSVLAFDYENARANM